MISVELHVIGGKHSGQVIPLNRSKFLIGREADCQLRPNSELVSRHHCIFSVDDFSVRLRDLGSTNGTTVNGERIRKEVVLHPGDHVIVGNLEFRVAVNDGASTDAGTGKLSAVSQETVVSGTDTLTEMPVESPNTAMPSEEAQAGAETTATPVPEPAAAQAAPQQPEQDVAAMPPPMSGDTTVIAQPAMMPGQMPYQPMMQQPMGYPPMYGNYPYPGMPGYPQQMPGYPQQMPGYPQQMPTAQPAAPAPAPGAASDGAGSTQTADGLNVSLPDPSTTGARAPEPKPAATGEENKDGGDAVASNQSAAAIIQQHRQRRPGG